MSIDASAVVVITQAQAMQNYPTEYAKALAQIAEVSELTGCELSVYQCGLGHDEDTPVLMLSITSNVALIQDKRSMLFVQPLENPSEFGFAETSSCIEDGGPVCH